MSSNIQNLRIEGSYREILRRTFPIIISFFIPQINYFINSIFIGHIDTFHLGAGAIVGIYYLIFSVMGIGFNSGIQILIARHAGAGDTRGIRRTFHCACWWALVMSLAGVLVTLFLGRAFFTLTLSDEKLIDAATDFMYIRIWGLPFLYLYLLRNALYINYKRAKELIFFSLLEAGVNIFLDYALIFGHAGLPALGFNGAAYASVIAEMVGFIAVLLRLYTNPLDKARAIMYKFSYHKKISKEILHTAIPITLQMALALVSWQLFFSFIANRDIDFLAASNVLRNLFSLLNIFVWAMGNTVNSMMSNLRGQHRDSALVPFIKKAINVSLAGTLIIAFVFFILRHFIISWFSNDPEVAALIHNPFLIILFSLQITGITGVFFNSLISLRRGKVIIFVELFAVIVYLIFGYLVANYYELSLSWIWSSEILYPLLMGGLSAYYVFMWIKKHQSQPLNLYDHVSH